MHGINIPLAGCVTQGWGPGEAAGAGEREDDNEDEEEKGEEEDNEEYEEDEEDDDEEEEEVSPRDTFAWAWLEIDVVSALRFCLEDDLVALILLVFASCGCMGNWPELARFFFDE